MMLCDVVPMEVTHILLGRPCQYDTKALNDGFTNKISFQHQDQKIILKPLSPRKACDDQIRMRKKREQEKVDELKKLVASHIYALQFVDLQRMSCKISTRQKEWFLSSSHPSKLSSNVQCFQRIIKYCGILGIVMQPRKVCIYPDFILVRSRPMPTSSP